MTREEIMGMDVDQLTAAKEELRSAGAADDADFSMLTDLLEAVNERAASIKQAAEERAAFRAAVATGEEAGTVTETRSFEEKKEETQMERNSVEYRNAWLNMMAGREITAEARAALTSATNSAGYAIPEMVANKIYENMVQIAPLIGEIDLMHIPQAVTLLVEDTVNAAGIHTEGNAITPASDTITRVQLGGYELVKVIGISAKLEAMSVDALEGWIVSNLSRKLAELIENYIVNGTGSSQPKGIDYAETWTDTTNAVDYAAANPTVAELMELISYLNGAYVPNAKFLCNWKTFMGQIFSLRDDKKQEVCKQEGGKYYVFGFPVVFSSKVDDGDLFFGDFKEAVKANFAQDIEIEADKSSGFLTNTTNFRGRCLFDCTTLTGRVVKGAPTL